MSARAAIRDPAWPARLWWAAIGVALLWPLLVATEFAPWRLFDARSVHATGRFLLSFFPPDCTPQFLRLVLQETGRTIAIATSGIALALCLAIPLALVSTAAISISAMSGPMAALPSILRHGARAAMVILRSVPELVWALLLVRVVGIGPTAGVLAIALTYGGMLGKVYAEILESCDAHCARTLLANGSGRLQALLYGLLPLASTELTSYTVYRWECAIRSSVVLGFVGAGGLGQQMDSSLKMLAGGEVATMLLVFIGLVALADQCSAMLRAWDRAPASNLHRPQSLLLGAAALALLLSSLASLDMHWGALFEPAALESMGRFAGEFLPPDATLGFVSKVSQGALETLAMSALGTLLAAAAGLFLCLPAAHTRAADWRTIRALTRLLLNALRAVPELVWAALLLVAAGLGPMAGVLALALHTSGVLGRLFAEAIENAPTEPAHFLRAQGASEAQVLLYATLPMVAPQLLSYVLYRWENNIRAATILGVVGAGGLGQQLSFTLGLFQMRRAATVIIAMILLVLLVDFVSHQWRRRMTT